MPEPENMTPEETVKFLAEQAMGWTDCTVFTRLGDFLGIWSNGNTVLPFNPLTDPADIWGPDMLMDRMIEDGWQYSGHSFHIDKYTDLPDNDMQKSKQKRHVAKFWKHEIGGYDHAADDPGPAICLAAVKAVLATKGGD